ncbi:MAG TPA: hypothetical protein P5150_08065 [Candidatus Ratteibacteria bacterium]|nr:hypothetical protein [Candidatus Ratteibacteria bacterium]
MELNNIYLNILIWYNKIKMEMNILKVKKNYVRNFVSWRPSY